MNQSNAAANSGGSYELPLEDFVEMPVAQQLPAAEFVLDEERDAGDFERPADPTGEDFDSGREVVGVAETTELAPVDDLGGDSVVSGAAADSTTTSRGGIGEPIAAPKAVDPFGPTAIEERSPLEPVPRILRGIKWVRFGNWPRTIDLRSIFSAANYPLFTSFALAAMIGVELVRVMSMSVQDAPMQAAHAQVLRPIAASNPGVDVSRILSAHLFGAVMGGAVPQDAASATPSTTQLVLLGTIATEDPRRGVAIVSDGEKSKVYVVGQDMGPATLHSVYLNHVVIDHQGNLETVSLPQRQTARTSVAIASNEAELNSATPPSASPPQSFHGGFNNLARMDAVNDGGTGKLRGFRLYPGNDSAAFQSAGLESGDLVVAVNGSPLTDARRSEELWNKVNSSAGVSLTIERDGRKRRLGVDLTSFAKTAGVDLAAGTVAAQTAELPGGPQHAGANPAAID